MRIKSRTLLDGVDFLLTFLYTADKRRQVLLFNLVWRSLKVHVCCLAQIINYVGNVWQTPSNFHHRAGAQSQRQASSPEGRSGLVGEDDNEQMANRHNHSLGTMVTVTLDCFR
jgi:hypothetical protein